MCFSWIYFHLNLLLETWRKKRSQSWNNYWFLAARCGGKPRVTGKFNYVLFYMEGMVNQADKLAYYHRIHKLTVIKCHFLYPPIFNFNLNFYFSKHKLGRYLKFTTSMLVQDFQEDFMLFNCRFKQWPF